ncbi:MAG: LacI family transcriptional regulator [Ruminococcaceae bacterium]|nr:LacI family transcriptional regulator [Oscillospiraceae bacterium]
MTLKDVAKRANVSVSTASKALRNSFDVSESTRLRVVEAAQALGYFHEKKKVTAENHRPNGWTFAVLCPEVISPRYSAAVQEIAAAVKNAGCNTVIYNTGFDQEEVHAIARACVDDPRIDAVLSLAELRNFTATVPVVVFSEQASPTCSTVHIDLDSALSAIRDKYDGISTVVAGEQLTRNYRRQIQSWLPCDEIIGRGRYDQAGADAAAQLLKRPSLPDLIICTYDEIAYGLIAHLTDHGVVIPHDTEVIAINNSYASRWVHDGVSAVSFDYGDVFQEVVRDVIADLQQKRVTPRHRCVSSRFIERNTTK